MNSKIYLFFVWSDFHLLICKNIIKSKNLNSVDCYFKVDRNVKLEDGDIILPSILEDFQKKRILVRPLFYLFNKKRIDSLLKGKKLEVFYPFVLSYTYRSFCKINYFEEGFSSYITNCSPSKISKFSRLKSLIVFHLVNFFFKGEALKSFVGNFCFSDGSPSEKIDIYTISPYAFSSFNNPLINKIVLDVSWNVTTKYNIPYGSYLMVLDRFSEGGRPYSLSNYFKCLRRELSYIQNNDVNKIWIKFHPADENKEELKFLFYDYVKDGTFTFVEFEGKLEYLAIQDAGISFIGTNSTILYYAPLYGNTNKSISFSRYLASIDSQYEEFMHLYGGIDGFVDIFSKNVECL